MGRRATAALSILLVGAAGCSSEDTAPDRRSLVQRLRVLAIRAEPPEVAPHEVSQVTALAVDPRTTSIAVQWTRCTEPPLAGELVNPDCLSGGDADLLPPIGCGPSVAVVMPAVDPSTLGAPDASGGLYLPLIAHVAAGSEASLADYRLRLAGPAPRNQNPLLEGVFRIADDGSAVALDDAAPTTAHAGDQITLRASFAPGSRETYSVGGQLHTETLTIAWFATAGSFTDEHTPDGFDTVLRLDADLPASSGAIDLWVVGRDERGGTDFLHRSIGYQ
jgi:hypothetical protein